MKEFSGHVAFVTGGASGIGAQVCRDLAAAGASVVVADLNLKAAQTVVATLPTDDGNQHLAVEVNVPIKAQVDAAVALVQEKYKRPADLIVNSAGIFTALSPLEDMLEEEFDRTINVNLKGTFLVTQAFGRALLKAGQPGSIVNLSSRAALWPMLFSTHYGASKAGVAQLTRVAAKEWGPKGIRVNSVHPGLTNTPMTASMEATGQWKLYAESTSLKRMGQPTDVSNAILFLLSDRSAYITGTGLDITGQAP